MSEKLNNKTCGECKSFPGMGYYCPIDGRFCDPNNEKPCEFFEKPFGRKINNGDKIIAGGNEGIAAFACGLLNDKREETFQLVLSFLNAPAESEGKDE